jgi:hypothetical protein
MMIGGTAIFSMKIAGLLWLLVGFMRFSENLRTSEAHLANIRSSRVPG